MDTAALVDKVDAVPLGRMYQASQRAMVRLQLYVTGDTQEKLLDFGQKARGIIFKHAIDRGQASVPRGTEGRDAGLKSSDEDLRPAHALDGMAGFRAQTDLTQAWAETFANWSAEVQRAREEAGRIAFGALAVMHGRMIGNQIATSRESTAPRNDKRLEEQAADGVFEPQLRRLLNTTSEYLYGDGLTLSARIWQMDREARDGMNAIVMNGVANGSSAWDMAKMLEQFLGASEDCPRWTSTRLYGMTKTDIASGDTRGLLSGDACDGSGVAYKALRLARTEIQKIHSLATDRMLAMQPWVEREQCNLSAAHPEPDECDDVVNGGEAGKGVYPVGSIEYPLHPNCLCYKTAVMMDQKDFTSQIRGWMDGTQQWPEMDQYAQELGAHFDQNLTGQPVVQSLAVWLFGEALSKWIGK